MTVESLDTIYQEEALTFCKKLPDNYLNTVVTSPPYYGLRDYGATGQIGLEDTPEQYVARLVELFREIRRVLRDDGTVWLNLGDSYASAWGAGRRSVIGQGSRSGRFNSLQGSLPLKEKDLIGIPWRVAFALQADGWWLRSDIIWHKPNPMPESVTDRPTKAHEYVFLLTKSARYWYDADAIRVTFADNRKSGSGRNGDSGLGSSPNHPGRNRRTVWTVPTEPKPFQHFAMFPQALIEPMVLAGCPAQVCCECGAPYERVTERTPMEIRKSSRSEAMGDFGRTCTSGTMTKPPTVTTLGFVPTCDCGAPTRPGIVYDPFMGSGTTALVAQRLGRHFIGTDINSEYVELARDRLRYCGDDKRMVKEMDKYKRK